MAVNFDVPDQVIEKIQKLLASNGRTPEESAMFAAKAQQLMEKYEIEMAQVEGFAKKTDKVKKGDRLKFRTQFEGKDKDAWTWQMPLLNTIARTSRCRLVVHSRWNGGYESATLIGRKENIEIATYVFDFLAAEIMNHWMEYRWSEQRKIDLLWESPRGVRRNWFTGCRMAVEQTLESEYQARMAAENDSKALIVVRDEELAEFMKDEFGHLRSARGPREGFGAGWQNGHEVGSKISVRRGVKGGVDGNGGLLQ